MSSSQSKPITRREALRRTVLFSSAAFIGSSKVLQAAPAQTRFEHQGLDLIAFGDYGYPNSTNQVAVAKAMAQFTKSLGRPLSAVLAMGDNFYRKLTPERIEKQFERMYSTEHLNCPFYVCAGNHDYGTTEYDKQEGKLQMELDYAKNNPTSRWKFPSKWYSIELPSPEAPLVKIIVLDGDYWVGGLTPKEKIAQRRYLQAELAKKSSAPWLWFVNHFPLYTDCTEREDNKSLIREWGKLLDEHQVSLCLAGHDHTMQHLQVEGHSTSFLVAGAGGAPLYPVKHTARGFSDDQQFGFCHLHVSPEKLSVQFVNTKGESLHRFERTRNGETKVRA
ncbi:MAG: metallophosphoesterase [Pirellulales bacterium]|nr:metallophosphoesterase [Pirellulales bacterium]